MSTVALEEILDALWQEEIGSCTCDVKTPELTYHSEDCVFKLLSSAIDSVSKAIRSRKISDEEIARARQINEETK